MIASLAADAPVPEFADKLALFGQFIGCWDIEGRTIERDGTETWFDGEWLFGWVIEGRSIQDVLTVWPVGAASDRPRGVDIGSTFRTYDPKRDAWWVSWHGPSEGSFAALIGRQDGDRIVLDGKWSPIMVEVPDRRFEWSFRDITPTSFTWQGRRSLDAGATWELIEEMRARRR